MSTIRSTFGLDRVLLPVVHPISEPKAVESIKIAAGEGCQGIFLINQGMGDDAVIELAAQAQEDFGLWVGINLLGRTPSNALQKVLRSMWFTPDGLWFDNAGVKEDQEEQPQAADFLREKEGRGWKGLSFGGVAFKYTRPIKDSDLETAARKAAPFLDVVTTSGDATGFAADPEKVKAMRVGVGPTGCLALASGVTVDNADQFLPYVDAYLVGTSIEKEFGVLDQDKLKALLVKVQSYQVVTV